LLSTFYFILFYFILFDQAEDVATAHPRIVEAVENMIKKGKWSVPGKLCFICRLFNPSTHFGYRLQREIRGSFSDVDG